MLAEEPNHAVSNDRVDTSSSSNNFSSENKVVSKQYQPGNCDVLFGRGKKCYNHSGNFALRQLVNLKSKEYSNCSNKDEKSLIIDSLVASIRRRGRFMKEEKLTGLWSDVDDNFARIRIAQMFRDSLHNNYRSSYRFKNSKRSSKHIENGGAIKQNLDQATEALPKGQKREEKIPVFGVGRKRLHLSYPCIMMDKLNDFLPFDDDLFDCKSEVTNEAPQIKHEQKQTLVNDDDGGPLAPTTDNNHILVDLVAKHLPLHVFDDEEPFEPKPIS